MADTPQTGADAPRRNANDSPTVDVAGRVRAFVQGGASQHNSRPAGEYIRSEAGGYEIRKHAAHTVEKALRSSAHKRGLIGGTLSMVAAAYVSRYRENMASHQKMFEHTARAKRGDFEGMTTVDIRELHENAHKYGTPHVESIQKAAAGELQRREEVRQREKRVVRHSNMSEDHAIRLRQQEEKHQQRLRHQGELNKVAGGANPAAVPGSQQPPKHPEVMTNAQHNEHRSKLARMGQQAAATPPVGYKGKLPLTPRTPTGAPAPAAKANMVQIRGKKGGMIEKNTATGKMHYLGRKAVAQKRVRANIDAAKSRLRGAG